MLLCNFAWAGGLKANKDIVLFCVTDDMTSIHGAGFKKNIGES